MNITLNQVNLLPVRTWKWLGVNGTAVEEEIPGEFAAWEPQALNLPQGIKQNTAAFDGAEQIETGMGKDAEQFVLQNQNAGIHLTNRKAKAETGTQHGRKAVSHLKITWCD